MLELVFARGGRAFENRPAGVDDRQPPVLKFDAGRLVGSGHYNSGRFGAAPCLAADKGNAHIKQPITRIEIEAMRRGIGECSWAAFQ